MSFPKPYRPDPEALAIQALGWLAGDAERLDRFLSLTGLDASEIRSVASDPGFLGAVLDHLLRDEPTLQAFAFEHALDPAVVGPARSRLPGAPDIHN